MKTSDSTVINDLYKFSVLDTVNNTGKPFVSIIMPAYRLSKLITYSINVIEKTMDTYGYNYEIIVVDDGSPDDTYNQALKVSKDPTVRVYKLPRNMGKGYALLHGFRRSKGEIVVFFDGDLDIDPRQIHLLISALKNTKADIVITSKWHPQSKTIATPIRKFLSKAFYALARLLLGLKVSDTQTGAKAFKRNVLEDIVNHLTIKRYAFDVELLTAATTRGYKIVEVPALWKIKLTSSFKTKEIWKMFIDLLAITYRHRVKKQYTMIRSKETIGAK